MMINDFIKTVLVSCQSPLSEQTILLFAISNTYIYLARSCFYSNQVLKLVSQKILLLSGVFPSIVPDVIFGGPFRFFRIRLLLDAADCGFDYRPAPTLSSTEGFVCGTARFFLSCPSSLRFLDGKTLQLQDSRIQVPCIKSPKKEVVYLAL